MEEVIVVASGDWHLDWFTSGFPRYNDVRKGARAVVEHTKRRKADLFAFLGDLSDPDTMGVHAASDFATEVASELATEGIPSVWVAGNHDVVEDGCCTSVLSPIAGMARGGVTQKLVRVFERPGAYAFSNGIESIGVVALPFPPRSNPYDPTDFVEGLAPIPDEVPVLVLGHLWIEGADPGSETLDMPRGRSVFWPIEACRQAWGQRAILIGGHYHAAGYYRDEVHIAGSLERLTFGEWQIDPGFLEIEITT